MPLCTASAVFPCLLLKTAVFHLRSLSSFWGPAQVCTGSYVFAQIIVTLTDRTPQKSRCGKLNEYRARLADESPKVGQHLPNSVATMDLCFGVSRVSPEESPRKK